MLIDTPATYSTRRATMTASAAAVVVRQLLAELQPMVEALQANAPDADDTERVSPATEADVRAMRFHANEARIAYDRDDYAAARRHIEAANDRYQQLVMALPELEE